MPCGNNESQFACEHVRECSFYWMPSLGDGYCFKNIYYAQLRVILVIRKSKYNFRILVYYFNILGYLIVKFSQKNKN